MGPPIQDAAGIVSWKRIKPKKEARMGSPKTTDATEVVDINRTA